MAGSRPQSLLAIDALGGAALAACAFAFCWLTLVRGDEVAAEIADLTRIVQSAELDLAGFRSVRDRQRVLLEDRSATLISSGQLPEQPPVERYFQVLSMLAARHELRVRSHYPLSPRQYPGLLELRYAYELSGTLPDIVRFFRDVEQTEFWADISFVKISREPGAPPVGTALRAASLTISLFSALPADADSTQADGG
jgi:hypothetical protein